MKLFLAILAIVIILAVLGIIDMQSLLHDLIDVAKEFLTTIGGAQ